MKYLLSNNKHVYVITFIEIIKFKIKHYRIINIITYIILEIFFLEYQMDLEYPLKFFALCISNFHPFDFLLLQEKSTQQPL